MKIDYLILKSFKGFEYQEIKLDGKSTVLFGVNGAGKSTVLDAINILFARIINKITANRFKQVDSLDIDDIKFGESETKIAVELKIGKTEIVSYHRMMERKNGKRTHSNDLDTIAKKFNNLFIEDEESNMPIYANYGTHRAVHVVPIQRIRNKHTFDKLSAFEKAIENQIDFRMFFEWFREQQEFENDFKVNKNKDYVDRQLNCAKKAIITMLDGFTDIKIMFNPVRMVATKDNENLKIEQLSDGEKCTLAMIGDLARRLALANPSLDNPLEGEGIVLIDEVELHLHPTWQARIVPTLMATFPNIQFIITTHSPKVLGEVDGDVNIFELEKRVNDIVLNQKPLLVGWDSNFILEQFMGTSSLKDVTKGKIRRMFELIESKSFEEAEIFADELEDMTDSANPNVVKARILIKRGKAGL